MRQKPVTDATNENQSDTFKSLTAYIAEDVWVREAVS
jgi:hypothetical protein